MFLARAAGAISHRSTLYKTRGASAAVAGGSSVQAFQATPPPVPQCTLQQQSGLHTSGAGEARTFDYPTLSRAKLVRLEGGQQVPLEAEADATSLWANTGAVFFAIRRPG